MYCFIHSMGKIQEITGSTSLSKLGNELKKTWEKCPKTTKFAVRTE